LEADHPALQRAAQWLLRQEIRRGGDWQIKNPDTRPGGWAFEFKNEWYPDLDDSAVVPRALEITSLSEEGEKSKSEAIDRALRWVVDMQSKDGGWAAFDRDNDKQLLNEVPFADFMSPLDPTCPDVTAHVIELLSEHSGERPALERGLAYIKSAQESDGAWYGRWGVNYLYGTGLVLASLRAAGEDPCQGYIQQAVAWLVSHQNPDGGWGETCLTYQDPSQRGHGPSTASQTAWALTGLIAANELSNPAVRRGIEYLISTQQPDGGWVEEFYTGTGFPRVFYLRYDLYRIYFPLISLARYRSGDRVASD
jgi:squalene-hopene/tetraprenyl-beta-curcumene cyclase